MTYNHLDELKEYITKRKEAFESKILGGENPFEDMHFCNNSKHLDSMSQAIIKSCTIIRNRYASMRSIQESASLRAQVFNLVCYRIIVDRVSIYEMTGGTGIFEEDKWFDYLEYVEADEARPKGRYRLTLQNTFLWKKSKVEIFNDVVKNVVDELVTYVGYTQEEIYKSSPLKKLLGIGDFLAYQFSSDLLYIPEMKIEVAFTPYHSAGTGEGFEILTGSKHYNQDVIELILSMNSMLNHRTEFTKWMIPSDACNVLCEFKKYMSTKKRSRSKKLGKNYSVELFPYTNLETPESIKAWNGKKTK